MREAVLKIFYQKNGELRCEAQGKFYYLDGKPTFLANMTERKWWRNYAGYSIAKQLLDAFSKAKIKPQIIYRIIEKSQCWYATPTLFKTKGILANYGYHEQYVLPQKNWKVKQGNVSYEPMNLPEIVLHDWLKTDNSSQNQVNPKEQKALKTSSFNEYAVNMARLAEMARNYAKVQVAT